MNVKPLIKDEMLVVRVTSAFKATLQLMAKEEHRPLGNLIEHVLLDWLAERGAGVRAAGEPLAQRRRGRKSTQRLQSQRLPPDAAHAARRPRRANSSRPRKRP
jgi:hypothetical protein